MKRAMKGGEVGPNSEYYPGGSFMPEEDKPKGLPAKKRRGQGKQEVAPYRWTIPPLADEGTYLMSLYKSLAGIEVYDRQEDCFSYNKNLNERYFPPREDRIGAIEAYNRGMRWIVYDCQDRSPLGYADLEGQREIEESFGPGR
jgi:hypothetical protein